MNLTLGQLIEALQSYKLHPLTPTNVMSVTELGQHLVLHMDDRDEEIDALNREIRRLERELENS